MKKGLMALGLGCAALGVSSPAGAVTECTGAVSKIYAGDGGEIWIFFSDWSGGVIPANDPNKDAATALVITAKSSGRQIVLRYTANGANCNTFNYDFVGVFLL